MPLMFLNTQFPPIWSLFSMQSNGSPRSWSSLAAAIPLEPAPMIHVLGKSVIEGLPDYERAILLAYLMRVTLTIFLIPSTERLYEPISPFSILTV